MTDIRTEINILQHKLQNILQEKIQENLKFMKQKYFAGADKAGRLLASLIKQRRAKAYVDSLVVDKKKVTGHTGIKGAFVNYFNFFYKSKSIQQKEIQDYL